MVCLCPLPLLVSDDLMVATSHSSPYINNVAVDERQLMQAVALQYYD